METDTKAPASRADVRLEPLVRKPRHGWFAHVCKSAEDGWCGPYSTIEQAAAVVLADEETDTCYVALGRKLRKYEIEEMGADYTYEVESRKAIKLVLPNEKLCREQGGKDSDGK